VKYNVIAMPPMMTPCQRGNPATTSSTAAPAINCAARIASVPIAISTAIIALTLAL
jgi:hypothetical protein